MFPGQKGNVNSTESVKAIVAMALRPYPFAAILVLSAILSGTALAWAFKDWRPPSRLLVFPSLAPLVVRFLALGAFGVSSFIMWRFYARMPHIADESGYLYQAKLLASGRTHIATPGVPEAFAFVTPPFIVDYHGRWASFYPFGHPLLLAVGTRVGAAWLIPPAVAAASVLLIFVVGRGMFSSRVGVIASLMLAGSPFFLMNASTFMSHNTAGFYLLASLASFVEAKRRPILGGTLSGLFFGLLFNTRPLTAVTLVLPFAAIMAPALLIREMRGTRARVCAGFALGGLAMLVAYALYNHAITGSFLANGYQASGDLSQTVGFSGGHNLASGIDNDLTNVAALLLILDGWPAYVGLMFVLLPFVLGSRNQYDWFLLVSAVLLIAVPVIYYTTGMVFGPRYLYEALPFLILLNARGVEAAITATSAVASRFMSYPIQRLQQQVAAAPVVLFVLVLVTWSTFSWLTGRFTWRMDGVTSSAAALEGVYHIDDHLVRTVEHEHVHNALVVVVACPTSACYSSVFWQNAPTLDGDVVYVTDLGFRNAETYASYPCRNLYFATYDPAQIENRGQTPPAPGSSCS